MLHRSRRNTYTAAVTRALDAVIAKLATLPADEQEACKKFWADVEVVVRKVQEKPK